MATRHHTTLPAQQIDDALRARGRCRVYVPNTSVEFEITHKGVEVISGCGTHYVMYQQRDLVQNAITFLVTVEGRWECRATQNYGGEARFEVIDKAGDPFGEAPFSAPTPNNRRKKLLLCKGGLL